MIGVVLVDDQAIVRSGVGRILSPADGFTVVAEFADGEQLLTALDPPGRAPPGGVAALTIGGVTVDVVVMDIRMPGLDGIATTARLGERADAPPVLILTTFGEEELLWAAVEAGASGFALKDASAPALIAAVTAVAGGGAWFDPAVAAALLDGYRRQVAPARRSAGRADTLTEREREVLVLIAGGATNGEIAAALFVSEATVKTHVGNIFTKLGARDRAAAIVYAYDHGLV